MKVTILYRTEAAFRKDPIFPMQTPDPLPLSDYYVVAVALEVNGETQAHALEDAYRKMNVVDGDEYPAKVGLRSMMTGDIVAFPDGTMKVCQFIDWGTVTLNKTK